MQKTLLSLEINKYSIKLENFEGPLDLLCHLVDKNKMEISKIKISDVTDQYIEYLNKMEELNLDIASEFLIMASTLVYIKSKTLLPKETDDEAEITEEELIRRIIDYKKYKEISNVLRQKFDMYSQRFCKVPDIIELPKQSLETSYDMEIIYSKYANILEQSNNRINQNAINIEKIAVIETVTVASKVKQMLKELMKKPTFVFNKLFSLNKCKTIEVVTAFSGLLELSKQKELVAEQKETFGEILVKKCNTTD